MLAGASTVLQCYRIHQGMVNIEGHWESFFENDSSVVFILDKSFRFLYCNTAWDRFARENGADPALLRDRQIGRSILDVTPEVLKDFYLDRYEYVLRDLSNVEHFYECSSPDTARQFHMRLEPVEIEGDSSPCILVVNSLHSSAKTEEAPVAYDPGALVAANGLITMCAHCRRVKVPESENLWIWVPALVRSMPRRVSHGLCPPCFGIHYGTGLRRKS